MIKLKSKFYIALITFSIAGLIVLQRSIEAKPFALRHQPGFFRFDNGKIWIEGWLHIAAEVCISIVITILAFILSRILQHCGLKDKYSAIIGAAILIYTWIFCGGIIYFLILLVAPLGLSV